MLSSQFTVDGFKNALSGGGARPNQFSVSLSFPAFVGGGLIAAQQAPFLVTSTTLPGSIVGVAPVMYRGREVHFAGDRQFSPWSITVVNDSTMGIRNSFEEWLNGVDNLQNKSGRIDPLNYQVDMLVQQLDRNNTVIKEYFIHNAFPTNVSDIGLDFGANDQMEQFSVELVYQDFQTNFVPLTAGETFQG